MPAKKKDDEQDVVTVQGAEPLVSESEAADLDRQAREARAARARAEDRGATTQATGQVGGEARKAADREANKKVKALRQVIDPASQQLVGYEEVEVTQSEADAGLPATTPKH